MEFNWDPKKAKRNLRKHQVSFEEAVMVFSDSLSFTYEDEQTRVLSADTLRLECPLVDAYLSFHIRCAESR